MLITASAANPPSVSENYATRFNGPDKGLITAWLVGLEKRQSDPDLAGKAQAGELPPLPYKGGVEKKIKTRTKIGSLWYVAAWRGLRGEDLEMDTMQELQLVCTKTLVPVTYTFDQLKLFSNTEATDV